MRLLLQDIVFLRLWFLELPVAYSRPARPICFFFLSLVYIYLDIFNTKLIFFFFLFRKVSAPGHVLNY